MIAQRLDGKREAERLLRRVASKVRRARRPITLATVLVGTRYDSTLYVKLKRQAAARVGIRTEYHHLPQKVTQAKLERLIKNLNRRRAINGILLQLPLPPHLNTDAAIAVMDPKKDVDGFHPRNRWITPPPVAAVQRLIALGQPTAGSFVGIVAKDSVFSERLSVELEQQGYYVISIEPHPRLRTVTTHCDVVVSALGAGLFITPATIKHQAIVIDVGIRQRGQHTVGDVTTAVWKKAKAISPVPGGVGPMTIAYVLTNTYQLAKLQ